MHWNASSPIFLAALMLVVWGAVIGSRRFRNLTSRGRVAIFACWATSAMFLFLLVIEFKSK